VTIPSGYYQKFNGNLKYEILNWNENEPLPWYIPSWVHRGDVYTNISATLIFTLSDFGPNDADSLSVDPIPYFDVNITNINGEVNFTAANLSNSEIAINLILGYMKFQPGLFVRNNMWDELAAWAYNQSSVERSWEPGVYDNATVIVDNNTLNKVTYKFNQTTGLQQKTELQYSKTTGILEYAKTSCGNYVLEIKIIEQQRPSIPSYNTSIILLSLTTSILLILFIYKKKNNELIKN